MWNFAIPSSSSSVVVAIVVAAAAAALFGGQSEGLGSPNRPSMEEEEYEELRRLGESRAEDDDVVVLRHSSMFGEQAALENTAAAVRLLSLTSAARLINTLKEDLDECRSKVNSNVEHASQYEHDIVVKSLQSPSAAKPSVVINLIKRLEQFSPVSSSDSDPASYSISSDYNYYYVQGVTKVENKIYVLCHDPNLIRVFEDRSPFRLLSEIQLSQVGHPWAIVYNDISNCFYVSDAGPEGCIWKVVLGDRDRQGTVIKWLTNVSWPYTLSLSTDGHLLILRDEPEFSQLEIYDGSDARLVRSLRLPSDIKRPLHAIQTRTGEELMVAHRLKDGENGEWVISRLTSDGQTISGQSSPKNESEKLIWPFNFVLDENRMFVADYYDNRVIFFDANSLSFNQNLLTKKRNGIQRPNSLYYDREKNQLIVGQQHVGGDFGGGVVDVYNLQIYEQ